MAVSKSRVSFVGACVLKKRALLFGVYIALGIH